LAGFGDCPVDSNFAIIRHDARLGLKSVAAGIDGDKMIQPSAKLR
jgi:hypothetical protein